ncbi:fatty acid desaturase family protein [Bacterioplanoides sp.]|uniref:fatty acid desaturase family protein n=1 Tax=Bacterioplanoides sp. TaxID=2066072 RepID=UPI003B5A6B6C
METYLTKEEKAELRKANDLKAWAGFATSWGLIAAAMAMVAMWSNPLTIILALVIIGGRQLALGILLHECSHRSWFCSQAMNDWVGHWLAGIPMLVPMDFYRPYHFAHHTKTGTDDDPDVDNIRHYPVSKNSFRRKLLRDFTGQSGIKTLLAVLFFVNTGRVGNARAMGKQTRQLSKKDMLKTTLKNYRDILIVHGFFFVLLWSLGQPLLYLLWWVAFLIPYQWISRIRQVGEHGAMPQLSGDDVRLTTRTTVARWWERLLFAPHYVNYHCEHHLVPTVPSYNLGRLHQLVKARGFYQEYPDALAHGYGEVIRKATTTC